MIYQNHNGILLPNNEIYKFDGSVIKNISKRYENINGINREVFTTEKWIVKNGVLMTNIYVLGNKTTDRVIFKNCPFYTEQRNGYVSLRCGSYSTTRHGRMLYALDFDKMGIDILQYNKIYISANYYTFDVYSSEGTGTNSTTVYGGIPYHGYYSRWQQRSATLNYFCEYICNARLDGEGCDLLLGDLGTSHYSGNYTFRINNYELRILNFYLYNEEE